MNEKNKISQESPDGIFNDGRSSRIESAKWMNQNETQNSRRGNKIEPTKKKNPKKFNKYLWIFQ